jgi:hypothetical protein
MSTTREIFAVRKRSTAKQNLLWKIVRFLKRAWSLHHCSIEFWSTEWPMSGDVNEVYMQEDFRLKDVIAAETLLSSQ